MVFWAKTNKLPLAGVVDVLAIVEPAPPILATYTELLVLEVP